MSDPDLNPNFRRRWDAPPLKPNRPPMGGTIGRAGNLLGNNNDIFDSETWAENQAPSPRRA
jgi:hypothetical protein